MEAVLLIGIPASGKSSFYAERFASTHLRINLDMLRTRHREKELVATCLRLRQPFVVDDTNASRVERTGHILAARAAGFRVVGYYLSSKLEECLLRNAARAGVARIPEKGVLAAAGRLELPELAEGFDALHFVRLADGAFVVEEWRDELR
ncbi:MAG: ATP-binding protein [Planctomycetes bacterium]|nr:ATP-binding protein [Planctomycetota bacterium]